MIGPLFALLSALCFATASASIAKGAGQTSGDNGAFLSVVMTLIVAGTLWLLLGNPLGSFDRALAIGAVYFALSGVLSTVVGRLTLFRSVELAGAIQASLFRRLTPLFGAVFAFVILGETVGYLGVAGMAVVLASLFLVIAIKAEANPFEIRGDDVATTHRGQVFGTLSAGSYGASYVARKLGMMYVPDPTLGTFVGALSGLLFYGIAMPVNRRFRAAICGVFRNTGRWQLLAAALISFGQVAQFFALINTGVAVVAIIGSLEVFLSIYVAAYIFKSEPPPGIRVVVASTVATIGVILFALD
ncbi:EamA family transporter [Amorphus sp. 3PC139-8]|uniref:EamA family transporter n=1 Tax=Amorphus sp. 3PC139-8 TaxID=2735676 RepID=UPI00345D5F36